MLNPTLSNILVQFSSEMFPKELTCKYDNFLRGKNHPLKTLDKIIVESIKNIVVPGLAIPVLEVLNLANHGPNFKDNDPNFFPHSTMIRTYEGNEPWGNVFESKLITFTFRNYVYNWTYLYELLYLRFQRRDRVKQFSILITVMDPAEIPIMTLRFGDCFIEQLPALEFSFDSAFGETKTFDCAIRFNNFSVEMAIPEFDMKPVTF